MITKNNIQSCYILCNNITAFYIKPGQMFPQFLLYILNERLIISRNANMFSLGN